MTTLAPNAAAPARIAGAVRRAAVRRLGPDLLLGASLGGALSLFAFETTGGVDLGPNTWAEIVLTLIGAGLGVAAVLRRRPGRAWGTGTFYAFLALTALTIASIAWSVQPDSSWVESNRAVSYLAAFGGAVALARLVPERWPAIVGSLATVATVVCAYSLVVKVFPGTFDQFDPLGRINLPFDYWNAVGVLAAMGLPASLWAGARRRPRGALRVLAVPAVSILLTTLVLSYSRSAVIAAIVGVVFWFAVVPLRLRAATVLALGAAGAAGALAWALATHPLTDDNQTLAARTIAGHGFGLVLVLMLVLTTLAGAAVAFALDRVTLRAGLRRRIAIALLIGVAMIPVLGIGAVAASSRGLTGQISHVWDQLTNPSSIGVGDTAGRLLQVDNSRGRYWNEGRLVGEHALLKGVGAGAFGTARRYWTNDPVNAQHAHSYVVETFADLGLLGVAAALALLVAWVVAVLRTIGFSWRRSARSARRARGPLAATEATERIGLLTLLAAVITFGAQSAVDWTWFIPGVAVPALICAGWLAGRGPIDQPLPAGPGRVRRLRTPAIGAAVTGFVAVFVLGAWAMLGPLRAQSADASAITALSDGNATAALTDARTAANSDPLSVDPDRILWQIYVTAREPALARAELVQATTLQPRNADPWRWLGEYDLKSGHLARALPELNQALSLDLGSPATQGDIAQALTEKYAPRAPSSAVNTP